MTQFGYIKENLKKLEDEINEACIKYSRNRDDILLLPAAKTQGTEKILAVYESGYRCFGENRVQELLDKKEFLPKDIEWHMIGSLQTNKVRYIIDKVKLIHSLDRVSLLQEIEKKANAKGIKADCLIQINISEEYSKGGIYMHELENFLEKVCECRAVNVLGLMTIGPYTDDKNLIKSLFASMQGKFVDIGSKKMHNINMKYLSMGMSGDFREAIGFGANILRIGTTIFGRRG